MKVTTALRETLSELNIKLPHNHMYSDPRKNGTAVGVKIVRFFPSAEQLANIILRMSNKGFELVSVNQPQSWNGHSEYYNGIRLTYKKKIG